MFVNITKHESLLYQKVIDQCRLTFEVTHAILKTMKTEFIHSFQAESYNTVIGEYTWSVWNHFQMYIPFYFETLREIHRFTSKYTELHILVDNNWNGKVISRCVDVLSVISLKRNHLQIVLRKKLQNYTPLV